MFMQCDINDQFQFTIMDISRLVDKRDEYSSFSIRSSNSIGNNSLVYNSLANSTSNNSSNSMNSHSMSFSIRLQVIGISSSIK